MKEIKLLSDIGEIGLINIIDKIIHEFTGKSLIHDDSFFFSLPSNKDRNMIGVYNTDMLVSTTDIPPQMNYFQIGRKSVIMTISDLIVKNVAPRAIIISLGLPKDLNIEDFKSIIKGIVDCSKKYDLEYIGGDLNETKELIINPTVIGYQLESKIIYRKGIKEGDLVFANRKFGLTGVGFDILLNKKGDVNQFPSYKRSILSVLEPEDFKGEAFILARNNFVSASIDSSDGLSKSLKELISSNPNRGFEIEFNEEFIDEEAIRYSNEFKIPLKNLVLNAGEEFIHIFTLSQKDIQKALNILADNNMKLYQIGKIIPEEKIYIVENDKRTELENSGFEHFK